MVLNTFSYHLTPGGLMLDSGLRALGCTVIPGGVGNTAAQIEMARAAGATGYQARPSSCSRCWSGPPRPGCRSSYAALWSRGAVAAAAARPPAGRIGVDVYQSYGTADAGTLGYECEEKDGWHVATELVIEVLVPGDDRPAEEGEAGQVVVTSPNEVYPLVRFGRGTCRRGTARRARAVARVPPGGFLGRVGKGVKVKGMFVHPRELAAALGGEPAWPVPGGGQRG